MRDGGKAREKSERERPSPNTQTPFHNECRFVPVDAVLGVDAQKALRILFKAGFDKTGAKATSLFLHLKTETGRRGKVTMSRHITKTRVLINLN